MLMHKSGEWSERTFINQTHYLTQSTADSNYIFDAVISDFKLTAAHFDSVELKCNIRPCLSVFDWNEFDSWTYTSRYQKTNFTFISNVCG